MTSEMTITYLTIPAQGKKNVVVREAAQQADGVFM